MARVLLLFPNCHPAYPMYLSIALLCFIASTFVYILVRYTHTHGDVWFLCASCEDVGYIQYVCRYHECVWFAFSTYHYVSMINSVGLWAGIGSVTLLLSIHCMLWIWPSLFDVLLLDLEWFQTFTLLSMTLCALWT